jgi:hypothetical protein
LWNFHALKLLSFKQISSDTPNFPQFIFDRAPLTAWRLDNSLPAPYPEGIRGGWANTNIWLLGLAFPLKKREQPQLRGAAEAVFFSDRRKAIRVPSGSLFEPVLHCK